MNSPIIQKSEEFIKNLFLQKSPAENIYHSLNHTLDVVNEVNNMVKAISITDEEHELLILAAWFHDVGYMDTWENHEEISCQYASDFLSKENFTSDKIEILKKLIMATKLSIEPTTKLEEIMCDADLHHVGASEFFVKSELLRVELEIRLDEHFSDMDWLNENVKFFKKHKFYTSYSKEKYDSGKENNFLKIQKKIRKKSQKSEENKVKDEKLKFEKEKLSNKKLSEKKADRGVETMFRNIMRTHVSFSAMADNKANIMISVNTLLLGAIATILTRKLDTNPHLIIPTLTLSLVSLTTLIYAILVTRPKITEGTFSKDDIEQKKANLLFFGNFFNMNLKDFTWGMHAMMEDKEYLYGSMIKDFYFLGQVLGQKYKYLRICYSIFMYGMIISIIVFAIFVVLVGDKTAIGPILE